MRIHRLVAHRVSVPLRRRVQHASFAREESENIVVVCELDDGTRGYGEGVPRTYVTGEDATQSLALLTQIPWKRMLAEADCSSFAEVVFWLDGRPWPGIAQDMRQCFGHAARCALELAILDAYGRAFAEPLSAVTRYASPRLYAPRAQVQYSGAITSSRGIKAATLAWAMRWYGFAHLKVKVGIAGQDDRQRLRWVRAGAGPHMDIRVDANEAWDEHEAVEKIRQLLPYRISVVEQPLPHRSAAALATLRRRVPVAIMLDESLCSLADAEQAVRGQWCDFFNIRLSKCGGFIPSLKLVAFAAEHGIRCQLGCQVGETALLSAAGRHFASSVAGLVYCEGSYDRRLLAQNLSEQDITFGRGGWAPALTGPGLGISVAEDALDRLTVCREVLFE